MLLPSSASTFVFVTSTTYTGNLGGVSGADAKCNERAIAAGLPGVYKAWIGINSGGGTGPTATFPHQTGNYILPGGQVVANGWNDLTDTTIDIAINDDEFGTPGVNAKVWTNVDFDGSTLLNARCALGGVDWTSDLSSGAGVIGSTTNNNSCWSVDTCANPVSDCNIPQHLYCFMQGP